MVKISPKFHLISGTQCERQRIRMKGEGGGKRGKIRGKRGWRERRRKVEGGEKIEEK
jgi:hypothetical protein